MLKKKNLWRGLTMVFALLLAVSMMADNILELYRTSVDAFLGTRSTQTVTEQSDDESDAWTYKSEFTTAKEAYEGFKDFAIEASQETFALLKNENGALPLAKEDHHAGRPQLCSCLRQQRRQRAGRQVHRADL